MEVAPPHHDVEPVACTTPVLGDTSCTWKLRLAVVTNITYTVKDAAVGSGEVRKVALTESTSAPMVTGIMAVCAYTSGA